MRVEMYFQGLIILLSIVNCYKGEHSCCCAYHIALVLPDDVSPDIIKSAMAVVQNINEDERILPDISLQLHYSNNSVTYAAEIESIGHYNITALVGLFQLSDIQAHYPLAIPSRMNIPLLLSGSPHFRAFNKRTYPDLYNLVRPSTYIRFYRSAYSFLVRTVKTGVNFFSEGNDIDYNFRVSFVAATRSKTFRLLCRAYLREQVWPDYLWMVAYHQAEDLISYWSRLPPSSCTTEEILEGVVFYHEKLTPEDAGTVLVSGLNYEQLVHDVYNSTIDSQLNPYRNILHDAIWAVALTLNASLEQNHSTINKSQLMDDLSTLSFSGASGRVQFYSYKIRSSAAVVLYYQISNRTKVPFKNPLPSFRQTEYLPLFVIFFISNTASFIFITITMVLYCCYRKKPIIKSTSFSLSMLMFTGCYLLLIYLVFIQARISPRQPDLTAAYFRTDCLVYMWLNGIGIPSVMIFATLLVKMARVYHIFSAYRRLQDKSASDTALFLYVMLLMLPTVVILISWTVEMQNAYGLLRCARTTNFFLWLSLLSVYFIILMLTVVVVAILTRNIRYKNFKDTKKVNALVLILLLFYSLSIPFWIYLQLTGSAYTSRAILLQVAHTSIIVGCIGLLFVPKIYPLLKEAVAQRFSH